MPKTIFSEGQEVLQNLLRSVRLQAGLTQAKVAEKLKQPQSFVSKYEMGERRVDLVELHAICSVLGISLREFVNRFETALRNR